VSFAPNEEVVFDSFDFSVEGLDEWYLKTGVKVERDFDARTANISYSPLARIDLWSGSGIRLSLGCSCTLPGFPVFSEAAIKQQTYLRSFQL
jgi:hypothetical protein